MSRSVDTRNQVRSIKAPSDDGFSATCQAGAVVLEQTTFLARSLTELTFCSKLAWTEQAVSWAFQEKNCADSLGRIGGGLDRPPSDLPCVSML